MAAWWHGLGGAHGAPAMIELRHMSHLKGTQAQHHPGINTHMQLHKLICIT